MQPTIIDEVQQQITKEVAEFLKNGGKIKKLPYMPDEHKNTTKNTFKKHAARLEAARKRAMASDSWRKQSVVAYKANRKGKA